MNRAVPLSLLLLAATAPALAADPFPSAPPTPTSTTGNHAHQGQAKTLTTLSQWNIDVFTVKSKSATTLGKTGSLSCGDPAGCVLNIEAALAGEVKKDGTFSLHVEVDGNPPKPQNGFGGSCQAKTFCGVSSLGTIVVAQGTHKITYSLLTSVEIIVLSWSGHAQVFGKSANAG